MGLATTMPERNVYAVDLDGTLAIDDDITHSDTRVGPPVPAMLAQVKAWLDQGIEVWIFTARLSDSDRPKDEIRTMIQDWCEQQGLPRLKVTNRKSGRIKAYFDDRAYHVLHNAGIVTDTIENH